MKKHPTIKIETIDKNELPGSWNTRVLFNGEDISRSVQNIKVEIKAGDVVRCTLDMIVNADIDAAFFVDDRQEVAS